MMKNTIIYELPMKYWGNIFNKILIILHIKKKPFIECKDFEEFFKISEIYK